MIIYKKGSLFNAPKGSYLVHACNAQGVWDAGIALEFKKRFPGAFKNYQTFCKETNIHNPGYPFCIITYDKVVCLITSEFYGKFIDNADKILENTDKALTFFFKNINKETEVHSNKFNSGLFKVPWEKTEKLINKYLKIYPNVKWIVWENV